MCQNNTLDDIAEEIGSVTESSTDDETPAREGEEFDTENYERDKEDYDGGW